MRIIVKPDVEDTLVTRSSLLSKLRKGDEDSWQEFYDIYKKYVRGVAFKANLPESDVEDVVSETMASVNKHIASFVTDKRKGKFRTWLYVIVTSKIRDHLRRRRNDPVANSVITDSDHSDESTRTSRLESIPDPQTISFHDIWEREWAQTLLNSAIKAVRRKVRPEHFQAYELCDLNGEKPKNAAKTLNVSEPKLRLWAFRVRTAVNHEARLITKRINL